MFGAFVRAAENGVEIPIPKLLAAVAGRPRKALPRSRGDRFHRPHTCRRPQAASPLTLSASFICSLETVRAEAVRCGILAHGLARIRCDACAAEPDARCSGLRA
jgi:hypothetical protein